MLPIIDKPTRGPANNEVKSMNKIVMQSSVDKILSSNRRLTQRHLVLNSYALFVYKDDLAFNSFPHKPQTVIPLNQIEELKRGKILKNSICKASLRPSPKGT